MGWVGKILSFTRVSRNNAKISDVKVDPGGGPLVTAEHYAPAGDDSQPLTTDYALAVDVLSTGGAAITGYVDPINDPKAQPGDKRIYGRDADTGAVVVEVWLKSDGTAVVSNNEGSITLRPDGGLVLTTPASTFDAKADGSIKGDNGGGSFELEAGGDFVVNGVTIDTAGNITSPATITGVTLAGSSSVTADGKELAGHDHPINSGSSAPGPTGVNN